MSQLGRIIRPQPGPQEAFLSTQADIAIYGGAAGGGKTWGLLMEPLRHMSVRGFGGVIFRRTSPQIENEGGMWDQSYDLYRSLGGKPFEAKHEWYFPPHQNRIRFSHMEHEKNRFDWQGAQIPYIGWDELTHFTEEQFFYMLGRNRTTCGVRPYIRATTNPDADSWVADLIAWWLSPDSGLPIPARAGHMRWMVRPDQSIIFADTPGELGRRFPGLDPQYIKSLTFIPARLQDNVILMTEDPGYLAALQLLPHVERERLLAGNWKIRPTAGLVFNSAWFPLVQALPGDPYVLGRVRYWDKAATEGGGAFSAGVKMVRTVDGMFYVEDVQRGQWSSHTRNQMMRQTAHLDGPGTTIWIEQEPGSGGKESAEASMRLLSGYDVHIERVTGDKETRARPLAAQAEVHNVRVLQAPWTKIFLDELHGFPTARLKDQVDAASGAFNKLNGALLVEDFDPAREFLDDIPDDEYGGRIR